MLSQLRHRLEPLREALARPIAATGVDPNLVTMLAVPLALAACVTSGSHPGLALLLGMSTALVDFVDGPVARLASRTTAFGNLLDAVVDRVVEAALLAGLACRFPLASCAALGFSMAVSYVKARTGLVVITDNREWPGFGDRADRVVLILLALLMLTLGSPRLAELMLWLVASLSLVGLVQRLLYARRLIEQAEREGGLLPYLSEPRRSQ